MSFQLVRHSCRLYFGKDFFSFSKKCAKWFDILSSRCILYTRDKIVKYVSLLYKKVQIFCRSTLPLRTSPRQCCG